MDIFKIKLIILVCAAVGVMSVNQIVMEITPQAMTRAQASIHKCETETNAPSDAFRKLLSGIIEDDVTIQFAFCYLTDMKHMDKDKKFIPSSFFPYIKDDKSKEDLRIVLEECNKINEEDHTKYLRLLSKCYKEKVPIVFKVPE